MTALSASTGAVIWRVLVIDDNPDDRAEVRRLLLLGSEQRYKLTEAETGAAGVRAVLDADPLPDCVVLDYHLPDMDAVEVLAALTGPDGLTACPVVVLTGAVGHEPSRAVLRAGAQDYLGKAWMTSDSLTRAVENAAERHTMARELEVRGTALRETNQQLQMALSIGGAITYVWDIPNNEVRRLQGFASFLDATKGRPETIEAVIARVHPDDRGAYEQRVRQASERPGRAYQSDYRIVGPDGSVRWISDTGRVEFTADGKPLRLVGLATDITDRKLTEEALRESEVRLGRILRQSPAGIIQTDAAGCMTLVNPRWCEMLGYSEAELLDLTLIEITHPSFVGPTGAAFGSLAAGGPDFQVEMPYVRKDGSVLRAQSNVAAIRSPDGEFLGLIAVVLDISERIRSEEELRRLAAKLAEADRRKDVFLATLAHELRNPLAPIRNGLEIMRLSRNISDDVERIRAMMDRQLSHLIRLVDDLLDLSRITHSKVELRKERVDLKAVIDAAVETSQSALDQAGHELVVSVSDEPIFVFGDAARLTQVVSNLLHNSAKYTHQGGHVELTAGREHGTAVVSVKDNGIGIPPAMISRVFEMFAQLDRTMEKTTGGLGIGLAMVKALVEMHGGTIEAHSDGEGRGSEFVVHLPVVIDIVVRPDSPDGKTSAVVLPALHRILVVDDNVDSADSLGRLLKMLGKDVRTANDGEAGIEVAAQFRPDLVLMDIGMPKLNGYEAARRIRQHPWGQGMVLVALTGWGQEDDRKKSADAGFDHHLVKPLDMGALMKLMPSPKCGDILDPARHPARALPLPMTPGDQLMQGKT